MADTSRRSTRPTLLLLAALLDGPLPYAVDLLRSESEAAPIVEPLACAKNDALERPQLKRSRLIL